MPRVGRTRAVKLATRLGHERLLALERARVRNPVVRAGIGPLRWWLRRGSVRVCGGLGEGLRVSLAHMPVAHAHSGMVVNGWLEVSVQEALRRLLREGHVFYDVGANIGFFSLAAARMVGPAGHVYAFEPVPSNAAAVRANAELNGLANVSVDERAVGAAAGREELLLVEDLSWSHLASQGRHPRTRELLEVEVAALDELVEGGEIRPPDVVKIDVEGAEVAVLRGMRGILERHRPALVCELHGTAREFVEELEPHGYEVENLEGPDPVAEATTHLHALAVPASR